MEQKWEDKPCGICGSTEDHGCAECGNCNEGRGSHALCVPCEMEEENTTLIAETLAELTDDRRNWLAGVPVGKSASVNLPRGRTLVTYPISAESVDNLAAYGVVGREGQIIYTIVESLHDNYDSDHGSVTCWCARTCTGHQHLATEVI